MSDANSSTRSPSGASPDSFDVFENLKRKNQSALRATKRGKYLPLTNVPSEGPYVYVKTVTEAHKKAVYAVKFCEFMDDYYMAAVGDRQVTIYDCQSGQSSTMEPVRCFLDPCVSEEFYAVTWALHKESDRVFVVFGGKRGSMRVLDFETGVTVSSLLGHGDGVNEINTDPTRLSIVASASKDLTIRLWHVLHGTPLAILGGFCGHRDQVLTLYFHKSGNYIASGSMDHTIRVWNIAGDANIQENISRAITGKSLYGVKPAEVHFCQAESRDLHTNYVDCVRFIGNYIISKSSENFMCVSKFGEFNDPSPCGDGQKGVKIETFSQQVAKMELPNCDMWFIKFGVLLGPPGSSWLVCGNQSGTLLIWDLSDRPLSTEPKYQITHADFPRTIRHIDFSRDGEIMVAVGEDGRISRLNRRKNYPRGEECVSNDSNSNTDTPGSSIREPSYETENETPR